MNVHTPRRSGYSTTASTMPSFMQATFKPSIHRRGFEEVGIDRSILKPGSIVWARSQRLNRYGEDAIDTGKNRPYFLWDFQQMDEDHVPILHMLSISAHTKMNNSKFALNKSQAQILYGGSSEACIKFSVLSALPLTTEFFTKNPKDFDSEQNQVIIRNPDHEYSSDEWAAFLSCRFDALMWNPSNQFDGPKNKDLSGVLAGIQMPVDFRVREEINEFAPQEYNMRPAPDFKNGPRDEFSQKFSMSCVHGLSDTDITEIALNAFHNRASRFIRAMDDQNRIRAIINGDSDALSCQGVEAPACNGG